MDDGSFFLAEFVKIPLHFAVIDFLMALPRGELSPIANVIESDRGHGANRQSGQFAGKYLRPVPVEQVQQRKPWLARLGRRPGPIGLHHQNDIGASRHGKHQPGKHGQCVERVSE